MAKEITPAWSPAWGLGLRVGDVLKSKQEWEAREQKQRAFTENHPNRCAAMDQNGVRCGIVEVTPKYVGYHGDNGVRYDSDSKEPATWVLVVLCQWHRTSYDSQYTKDYTVNGLIKGR